MQCILCEAIAKEQATCLDGGSEERSADTAVETCESVGAKGLTETIDRSVVDGRIAVWLGLKADLDSVEGIFDEFANNACCLVTQTSQQVVSCFEATGTI